MKRLSVFGMLFALLAGAGADAAAPIIFNTQGFESPVRGGPDDLLFLGGSGFSASDRVVYRAFRETDRQSGHPAAVPTGSTQDLGIAPVLKVGDALSSLTILLPPVVSADTMYRLWVVNDASEWSEPFTINDPRPMWVSPGLVYATTDFADLGRRIRIVGRNLASSATTRPLRVRLKGPRSYVLSASESPAALRAYVAEVALSERLEPGTYTMSVSREGAAWTDVPAQKLTVLPDPSPMPRFNITAAQFGACRPDEDSNSSGCLEKAIQTAGREPGGGIVQIPAGTWRLDPTAAAQEAEFTLTGNVRLEGAGADKTTLVRRTAAGKKPDSRPLLLLEGGNVLTGLKFMDEQRFISFADSRPVIQLGHRWDEPRIRTGQLPDTVRNVVISRNVFRRVGMAVIDGGLPIERLFVTHNDIGGYARGLELPGNSHSQRTLFRIEDAVIRWNRFVPGSYVDLPIGQGVLATGLGASRRVDFSSNEADGASTEALQEPSDQHGWRAAFFWNMHDNGEMLLVADNRISCSGDKVGDGEAIAFDGSGNTYGYARSADVTNGTRDSVTVAGELQPPPAQWSGPTDSYYVGHWIQLVAGAGSGQTRKIVRYHSAAGGHTTVFQVAPAWDVIPAAAQTRVVVARQFWQTYVIGNEITQAQPTCTKSNLSGRKGGEITMWAPSADSVMEANRQFDTNGLGFTQGYSATTPSCTTCANGATVQTALEIRGNLVQGEYDWISDCSWSGIHGTFGASPTPEAPPPGVSFGVQISHNVVDHADGLRGGAIDILPTWHRGPEPYNWSLIDNLIVAHNLIKDIEGPHPRADCRIGQRSRVGIRLEGGGDITGTVLYKNQCERTDTPLADTAARTVRVCSERGDHICECESAGRLPAAALQPNTSK